MTATDAQVATDTPLGYAGASARRVPAGNAIEYAYRDTGDSAVPPVLLQHFRGNLDNWDPALIDALAAERRVITFDNVGVAATTGTTPNTVEAMANDAIAFIEAAAPASRRDRSPRVRRQRRQRPDDPPSVLVSLAGLLPDARVTIYPDSAHGFLFQHHSQFAADVHAFLEEPD